MADRQKHLETLLAEGLDLCVRARKIDDGLLEKAIRDRFPASAEAYPEHYSRSGTPHLWVQDQYDKDLDDWEKRARDFLMGRRATA